jgi:SAM-dependent methyltransferase
MCNMAVIEFFLNEINVEHFKGKRVLEVGSAYVDGVRPIIERFCHPASYVGVDTQPSKGVDVVLSAEELVDYFGSNSFDAVISTEMLEHVRDWRSVVKNMKDILRPDGYIYITTRSKGFPFHAHPYDCWRYELEDMRRIFADFEIMSLKGDPIEPGIFLKAKKRVNQTSTNLNDVALYSMLLGKRTVIIPHVEDMPLHRRLRLLTYLSAQKLYQTLKTSALESFT